MDYASIREEERAREVVFYCKLCGAQTFFKGLKCEDCWDEVRPKEKKHEYIKK